MRGQRFQGPVAMAEVILKNIKKVYPHQEPKKKKKGEAEKKTNLQITDEGVLAAGSVLVRGFVGISRTESRKQKLHCGMAQRQRKRYLSASHFASARKRRKRKVPLSAECRVPLRMAQGKRRTCGRAAGEYLGTTV